MEGSHSDETASKSDHLSEEIPGRYQTITEVLGLCLYGQRQVQKNA